MSDLHVGRRAPDFQLASVSGAGDDPRVVALGDYQDQWLMLLFYPRDFSMI